MNTFPEAIPSLILIREITDRHYRNKPEVVKCRSVRFLRNELRKYLPLGALPSYHLCLIWVKEKGFVELIKRPKGQYSV